MKDYVKLGLRVVSGNAEKIGLKAGTLKAEQSAVIRLLVLRELIPEIAALDKARSSALLEILGLPFFGNDSQMRGMISKRVFGVDLPKGKVKANPEDTLSDLGIF